MVVDEFELTKVAAALAVPRPCHGGVEAEAHRAAMQDDDVLRVVVLRQNAGNDVIHVGEALRIFDENYLKKAVAKLNDVAVQLENSGDGGGICDAAKDEFIGYDAVVVLDRGDKGAEPCQRAHSLEHVSHVAERVLDILRGFVADVGESAEGRDVGEI